MLFADGSIHVVKKSISNVAWWGVRQEDRTLEA